MIFGYHKTLIWRDKFLRGTVKHRLRDPSEIRALDFKGEFRRSAICSPSATIAINGSIIRLLQRQPNIRSTVKNTVSPVALRRREKCRRCRHFRFSAHVSAYSALT
jgi:hypothetical protein